MDRLIASNSVPLPQAALAPAAGTPQYATDGNPATNTPATIWAAYQYNAIQEELMAVILAAGITPDKANWAQLLAAIRTLARGGISVITGSGNFTVPTGITVLDVELWGGGAGSFAAYSGMWSGGGAAGGYARKRISGLTPGQVIAVTIGGGGTAGITPGVSWPGAGGTTSFGAWFSATGGSLNGLANPTTNVNFGGGAGGIGSGGDVNIRGSSGSPGITNWPGMGGAAPGGGSMGSGTTGVAGIFPGGGAAGAGFTNNDGVNAYAGAAGAAGLCIVRW